jgi:hypothetical protein
VSTLPPECVRLSFDEQTIPLSFLTLLDCLLSSTAAEEPLRGKVEDVSPLGRLNTYYSHQPGVAEQGIATNRISQMISYPLH